MQVREAATGGTPEKKPLTGDEAVGDGRWRESKWLLLGEFILVALIFIADWYHLVPLSKTPLLLALAWISLRLRKVGWKGVGLSRFRSWAMTLAVGALCGVALWVFEFFLSQPLLAHLTGKWPDLTILRPLVGNAKLLLLALLGSWTLAAVGEELVYRGYLMNRLAGLGQGTRAAWISSLVLISILFGGAHEYQGVMGVIQNAVDGLLLGLMYLGCGRNLWVPIIAHGIIDTIDVTLIFWGRYPGV